MREPTRITGSRTRDNRRPRRRSERPVTPDLSAYANVVPITRAHSKRQRWVASNGYRVELITIALPGAPFDGTQRTIPPVEGTQFSVSDPVSWSAHAGHATTLTQLSRWLDVSEITVSVFCALAGIELGALDAIADVSLLDAAPCADTPVEQIIANLIAIRDATSN
jgi:hypothetical protein